MAMEPDRLETGIHHSHHHRGVYRDDPQLRKYVCKVLRNGWTRGCRDQGDTKKRVRDYSIFREGQTFAGQG